MRQDEGFAIFYRMVNAGSVVGKILAYGMRIRNPHTGKDGPDAPHDVGEMVIDLRVPPGDGRLRPG